ncbi:MAG: class I SAM-dependent methyltransferase [Clostridiales bacterium]|nr:class I SAM-dependent methyltransferase [Clostridiales bacterium]
MNHIYRLCCQIWQRAAKINDRLLRGNGDFSGWMSQEEAGISKEKGNQYQPSTDELVKVLEKFNIGKGDHILDIGCGKGKAMYLMSSFPFGSIEGYDLSEKLVQIANENFAALKLEQCRAVQADTAVFDDYERYNYFYIFNSFPQEIFEQMMDHILDSLDRNPRKCTFIYLNPVCHEYMVKHTPFQMVYRIRHVIRWMEYCCYTYTPIIARKEEGVGRNE